MSASFVGQLRSARPAIALADPGNGVLALRVEAPDIWETVRVTARADAPVSDVKSAAVRALFPSEQFEDDFILKLRGWEVLDSRASLTDAGVVNGSTLLLAYRRRRPVR